MANRGDILIALGTDRHLRAQLAARAATERALQVMRQYPDWAARLKGPTNSAGALEDATWTVSVSRFNDQDASGLFWDIQGVGRSGSLVHTSHLVVEEGGTLEGTSHQRDPPRVRIHHDAGTGHDGPGAEMDGPGHASPAWCVACGPRRPPLHLCPGWSRCLPPRPPSKTGSSPAHPCGLPRALAEDHPHHRSPGLASPGDPATGRQPSSPGCAWQTRAQAWGVPWWPPSTGRQMEHRMKPR